jgi:hypothetical protein
MHMHRIINLGIIQLTDPNDNAVKWSSIPVQIQYHISELIMDSSSSISACNISALLSRILFAILVRFTKSSLLRGGVSAGSRSQFRNNSSQSRSHVYAHHYYLQYALLLLLRAAYKHATSLLAYCNRQENNLPFGLLLHILQAIVECWSQCSYCFALTTHM